LYNSHHLIEHGRVIISFPDHFRKYCSPGSGNLIFRSRFGNDVKNPLPAQIEKSEQRSVIKFPFLKGLSANAISSELSAVLGPTAYSLSQVKKWCVRFTEGDLTCSDQMRTGRPDHRLGTELSQFLQEFPFATARQLGKHFNESKNTIKATFERELWLRKFSRRWVPHSLSESQKVDRIRKARHMLDFLQEQTDKSFNYIMTGDES
jgi:hypothetical protein